MRALRCSSKQGFDVTQDPALQGWVSHAQNLTVALAPQPVARAARLGQKIPVEEPEPLSAFAQDEGRDGEPEMMPDEVQDTSPWFSLSLGVELDGQRHNVLPWLPDLIAQAAQHPPDPATGQPQLPPFVYVPRGDAQGGFVRLPTEPLRPWLAALLELVGERGVDFSQPSLRLSRLEALRSQCRPGRGRGVAGGGITAGPGAAAPGRQPHRRGAPACQRACQPAPVPAAGVELAAGFARPGPGRHPWPTTWAWTTLQPLGPHPGRKKTRAASQPPRCRDTAHGEPDGQLV